MGTDIQHIREEKASQKEEGSVSGCKYLVTYGS